jgi:hypothetical protein
MVNRNSSTPTTQPTSLSRNMRPRPRKSLTLASKQRLAGSTRKRRFAQQCGHCGYDYASLGITATNALSHLVRKVYIPETQDDDTLYLFCKDDNAVQLGLQKAISQVASSSSSSSSSSCDAQLSTQISLARLRQVAKRLSGVGCCYQRHRNVVTCADAHMSQRRRNNPLHHARQQPTDHIIEKAIRMTRVNQHSVSRNVLVARLKDTYNNTTDT